MQRSATRGLRPAVDPVRRSLLVAGSGLLVTLAVWVLPQLRFAYANERARLVLETANGLIALLTSVLLLARFRRTATGQELLLAHSMGLLAVASLVLVTVPGAVNGVTSSAVSTWAPLLTRLVAAAMIVTAAAAPGWRLRHAVHPTREAAVGAGLVVALAAAVQVAASSLPRLVIVVPPAGASAFPSLEPHPAFLLAQVVNLGCYAFAAVAFTVQGSRQRDDFVAWIGAACAMGACSRLSYLMFPSMYSGWLYVGDLLRGLFYLLLLVACLRELRTYWATQVVVAAEAERRRLARDLHDGAVQELGYLRSQVAHVDDPELRERLVGAADRAHDETRRALYALTASGAETGADAVKRSVCEIGDRYDVPVRLEVEDPGTTGEETEALVRIAREAVSNAARHGRPSSVSVTLAPGRLVVEDDGRGFDPGLSERGRGFGLVSMRDRSEGLGGRIEVRSSPGRGTRVEVTW